MLWWLHERILPMHFWVQKASPYIEKTPFLRKCCLNSILWCDLNLMVPREPISEWIYFLSSHIIQYIISKQFRKGIMDTCIVKLSQIYKNPYFIFLLLFLNCSWAHPIRLLNWFNNTYLNHLFQFQVDLLLVFWIKAIWRFLNSFTSSFKVIFIISKSPMIPFKFENFVG